MPLDELARRFAEESYTGRMEKIIAEQRRKQVETQTSHSGQSALFSGPLASAVAIHSAETARLLAEARAETLMAAYERAGIPFDDPALHEIIAEVSQFMQYRERDAVTSVSQFVNQKFGGNAPSNVLSALTGQVQTEVRTSLADILRNLRVKRYETALSERQVLKAYGAALGKQWDVFISYASEDKVEFVQPLADALEKSGLSVWYAPINLTVGDKLRKTIDDGIAKSRFGVVVLSHHYFAKPWPQEELEALFSKEVEGIKVILPIWHKLTVTEVRSYSPMLAGRVAAESNTGVSKVVCELRRAMGLDDDCH